jgi:DNA-directed RNA polymerase I and III subunit RPAC1
MPPAITYDPRKHVGVHAERVSHVSSTNFPGHHPDEDHSWDLERFRKVRLGPKARSVFD